MEPLFLIRSAQCYNNKQCRAIANSWVCKALFRRASLKESSLKESELF